MITNDFEIIERAIKQAMQLATTKPGLYGGRYIGRKTYKAPPAPGHSEHYSVEGAWTNEYVVLGTDDPGSKEVKAFHKVNGDILCQAKPDKVYGIGRARYWINEDGTINREYFNRKV